MSRSKWKGLFVDKEFLNYFIKNNKNNLVITKDVKEDNDIKIFNYKKNLRNSTIIDLFVGYEFTVFNGIKYNNIIVNTNMVGFKFGDFSLISNVGLYLGRGSSAIRKYKRAVRKIQKIREKRERRIQKLIEKDD